MDLWIDISLMFTTMGFMILHMTVKLRCRESLSQGHCGVSVSFYFCINRLSHLQVVLIVVLEELFKEKKWLKIQLCVSMHVYFHKCLIQLIFF